MSAGYGEPRPRILVATTLHWASTTRLALAMEEAGLKVAVLAPEGHALHRMDAIGHRRIYSGNAAFPRALAKAALDFAPDLIVPGDDRAVRAMHTLYDKARRKGRRWDRLAATIGDSLGDPAGFAITGAKAAFATFSRAEGLPLPETWPVPDGTALKSLLRTVPFPAVLKVDHSWGGMGVRIVRNEAEARRAFAELSRARGWRSGVKHALDSLSVTPLIDRTFAADPPMALQPFVRGQPANRAVFCRDGAVLAGLTVGMVQSAHETGPATVVRVLDRPDIDAVTATIVRRLSLSGFVGVDFVIDAATGRAVLLELNPRPTQTCHFAFERSCDLVGAMAASLLRAPHRALPAQVKPDTIALFPQEVWRDPVSTHFATAHHDVPWAWPDFLRAYAAPVAAEQPGWLTALRRRLQSGARASASLEAFPTTQLKARKS